jgi:hypothetical protein
MERGRGMTVVMRFILLIAILAFAAPVQAADRRYPVADFDRVVVEGPYTVRIAVGRSSSAVASGSPQAIDAVSVEVQGMTLRVRRNPNAWGASPGRAPGPAVIILSTRNLRAARVVGSGNVVLSGARGLRVDLSVDGSGSLSATDVQGDVLSIGVRGAGSITLQGRAGTVTATIQGTGSLAATAFAAENATVAASTSGNVAMTVRRSANVTANGLGSVVIAGNPACTVSGPGAGEVRCGRPR